MDRRHLPLLMHVVRIVVAATLLVSIAPHAGVIGDAAAATCVFMAAFALTHDAAHGSLGLSRVSNEAALTAAASLMLTSGHAMRRMHLLHHARPMSNDDIEGAPAKGSLLAAILGAPSSTLALRVRAFQLAGRRGRRAQVLEMALCLAFLVAFVTSGSRSLLVYAATTIALQTMAPVWAAHVPHNAPRWMTRIAESLAWTASPTVLALAYHDLHHLRPEVPCQWLASAARVKAASVVASSRGA